MKQKLKGSVTIYLSIILVCVLVVVSVISEATRINVIQAESKTFTGLAGESVLAGYAKQVLEDYGILLVWEERPMEDQAKSYIQANINMADFEGSGTNFMNTDLIEVTSNQKKYITDNGGAAFIEQVLKYMEYGGAIDSVKALIHGTEELENNQSFELGSSDVVDVVDENNDEIQDIVKDVYAEIDSLKDTAELETLKEEAEKYYSQIGSNLDSSDNNQKNRISKFQSASKKIDAHLEKKKESIESTMSSIEKYNEKKKEILEKANSVFEGEDSVNRNFEILKNVEDKIIENKELGVSNILNIPLENIQNLATYISNVHDITEQLKELKSNEVTEQDEENKSLYEKAKALITDGVLSLVVDDVSKLSANTVSDSNLPSKEGKEKNVSMMEAMENKALMSLYAGDMFGNYTKEKKDTALKYEMEYILNGKDNDKENLLDTVEELILMRNVINAVYLLTDTQKMTEIGAVALSAATALVMPFLEPIIKAVLIEAWALAEAVSDVKALLQKKKVAVMKTKATWHTDLSSLSSSNDTYDQGGLTYLNYCQILMMKGDNQKIIFRTMDLIQMNIKKRYNSSFQMGQCLTSVDVTATYLIKPMFASMPWCINLLSSDQQAYSYEVSYKNSY